jgi:hypothetical protein
VAAAVVGGLLTAAGFAATVWETGSEKLAYLDSLVVDPLRSQIAAVLLHYGYMGIVPMLLALAAMTRSRWRIGGNIGLALTLPGALAVTGMRSAQAGHARVAPARSPAVVLEVCWHTSSTRGGDHGLTWHYSISYRRLLERIALAAAPGTRLPMARPMTR